MAYQFGNTLYRSWRDMVDGAVYEWWTAGGANDSAIIDSLGCSADGLAEADEMIGGWDLNRPGDYDAPSWMDEQSVTREELAEAIVSFWNARPDRLPA